MVHGGGHCSSGGGGGGYSGGGYSTTVYTTNYYSSSRSSRSYHHGNDCSPCWGTCCRTMFCVSLRPKSRIKYAWVLIFCISLIVGLSVGFGTYGKRMTDTSSSDMRRLNSGTSPRLCEGVEVKSAYPMSSFLLPNKPVIKRGDFATYTYEKFASLNDNMYEYWGFYLLEGSKVKITACSKQHGMDYYFIKGEHNLKKWQDDNLCSSCFETHKSTSGCNYGNSTFTHDIYTSGEYYFVFANHLHARSSVSVTLQLRRTTYDLSSAIHSCRNASDCVLRYSDADSDESIVVALPDINVENIEVYSTCLRRSEVFVAYFLIMPFGIGIVITILIYCICIRKKANRSNVPYSTLSNQTNGDNSAQYSTFQQTSAPNPQHQELTNPSAPPPSYNEEMAPPSYEETMKYRKN